MTGEGDADEAADGLPTAPTAIWPRSSELLANLPMAPHEGDAAIRRLTRARAYIDGYNLYYGALKRHPEYRWLDIQALVERLLPGTDLQSVVYCTARAIDFPHNPGASTRQDAYLRALKAECPKVEIVEGEFQMREVRGRRISHIRCSCCAVDAETVRCECCVSAIASIEKPEEKGTDVNIAVRLVADAYENAFDTALVLSGDSDLQLAIDIVRELGKAVLVCNPRGKRVLIADDARTIRQRALSDCQLPDPVAGADGRKIHRPASWSLPQNKEPGP